MIGYPFKRNKFGAQKSGSYDSKVERMIEAKYGCLQRAGLIKMLQRCRFHFLIIPKLSHIEEYDEEYVTPKKKEHKIRHIVKDVVDEQEARYTPDFLFYDCETNEYVMLEVKSFITEKQQDYKLRKKLIKWIIRKHNENGRSQWRFDEIKV